MKEEPMSTHHKPLRYFRVVAILAVLTMFVTPFVSQSLVAAQSTAPAAAGGNRTNLPPLITHNPNKGPTGYTVTFRYRDPSATRVQIKGEWYFESPWELPQLASMPGNPVQTPGLLPSQWQPGDVPIAYPNSTNPNWPVVDMTKNGDGLWTYTTPLPSGVFTYGFYVNCADLAQVGCTEVFDPSNPPWTVKAGVVTSAVNTSQVNV